MRTYIAVIFDVDNKRFKSELFDSIEACEKYILEVLRQFEAGYSGGIYKLCAEHKSVFSTNYMKYGNE